MLLKFLQLTDMSDVEDEDSGSGGSGISSKAEKNVIVGVCAMGKKSGSKPMLEILARLDEFEYVKTLIFPEETILKVRGSLRRGSESWVVAST